MYTTYYIFYTDNVCMYTMYYKYVRVCVHMYMYMSCTLQVITLQRKFKGKKLQKNVHIVPHVRNETPLLAQAFLGSDPQFPTSTFQGIFHVHSIGVTWILTHFLYYLKSL